MYCKGSLVTRIKNVLDEMTKCVAVIVKLCLLIHILHHKRVVDDA